MGTDIYTQLEVYEGGRWWIYDYSPDLPRHRRIYNKMGGIHDPYFDSGALSILRGIPPDASGSLRYKHSDDMSNWTFHSSFLSFAELQVLFQYFHELHPPPPGAYFEMKQFVFDLAKSGQYEDVRLVFWFA